MKFLIAVLVLTSAVLAGKIQPELRSAIESAPAQNLQVIIVATDRLSAEQVSELNSLNARLLINFTLAPWYEIEMPAANVLLLEGLDFVKEIKYVKAYALANEEKIVGEKANYNVWLIFILVIGAALAYPMAKNASAGT